MKKYLGHICFLGISLLIFFGGISQAESSHQLLTKETFMEMESVGNPNISPDGTKILFSRSWVDKITTAAGAISG